MAIKNSTKKNYPYKMDEIMAVLRTPDFATMIDAALMLDGRNPEGIVFQYLRKTTPYRYGRNFEILLTPGADDTTDVKVTTQSRKVTVLIDPNWEVEAGRLFSSLDILLKRDGEAELTQCKACGAPIGKEDKFCKECGAKNEK